MEQLFSIQVFEPLWRTVFKISKGQSLQKGRHGLYHDIINATQSVNARFGCYAWADPKTIYYCGSYSKDYKRGKFKTNLQGRIHNYLQNHKIDPKTKRVNTNLMVFENINQALLTQEIDLCAFSFEFLEIGNTRVTFEEYTEDSHLVLAVEELLICTYRRLGQCAWNRT